MALDKRTQLLRAVAHLIRVTEHPHFFGRVTIDIQDSVPVYTRTESGKRIAEMVDDQDYERRALELLES